MFKKFTHIVCFTFIFALLFSQFTKIFRFKDGDGIYQMTEFYKAKEDSIDVMCFGSSHAFENINTGILWKEYGIADFNLCGAIQPMWNTYYYMKEALKTQHPKVIVLDVYSATHPNEYSEHSQIIKNNYGMKFSADKLASIKISSPEESRLNYILEYPTYHNRYTEIKRADFTESLGNKALYQNRKGFVLNTGHKETTEPLGFQTEETSPVPEKQNEYLSKIIELSKENEIPLVLIVSPYPGISKNEQKIYNQISEIAREADIPFVNFNLLFDEIKIDFSQDYADAHHLNYNGNIKFTKFLADYLKTNFEIPDRRNDSDYSSYEEMSLNYYQQLNDIRLAKNIKSLPDYLEKSRDKNYTVVYSIHGNYKDISNFELVKKELMKTGIDLEEAQDGHVWIVRNREMLYSADTSEPFSWHTEFGEDNKLMVSSSDNRIDVNFNTATQSAVTDGLNILIYDNRLEILVESAGFAVDSNQLSYTKTTANP